MLLFISCNLCNLCDLCDRYYYIIVLEVVKDHQGNWINPVKPPDEYEFTEFKTYAEYVKGRKEGEYFPYITANITAEDFSSKNGTFVVGDQSKFSSRKQHEIYENGPLFAESRYYIFERAHVSKVCTTYMFYHLNLLKGN